MRSIVINRTEYQIMLRKTKGCRSTGEFPRGKTSKVDKRIGKSGYRAPTCETKGCSTTNKFSEDKYLGIGKSVIGGMRGLLGSLREYCTTAGRGIAALDYTNMKECSEDDISIVTLETDVPLCDDEIEKTMGEGNASNRGYRESGFGGVATYMENPSVEQISKRVLTKF